MEGYAFVRSETYARSIAKNRKSSRPTLKGVAYEADRRQGYCPDVDAFARPGHRLQSGPREPVLLYGMAPSLIPGMAERDIKREKQRLKGSRRDVYKTTHCIQSSVISTPVTPAAYECDPALRCEVDAFFMDAIAYIQDYVQRRGGQLVSAVLHLDESFVHIHTFALPQNVPGYRARELDPAGAAVEHASREGLKKSDKDAAASAACERFRQDFAARVAARYGLELPEPNPGTARKTRRQVKAEREALTPEPQGPQEPKEKRDHAAPRP